MSTEEKLAAAAALKDKGNAAFKAGAGRGCRPQAGQALRRRRCACACPTGRGTCKPQQPWSNPRFRHWYRHRRRGSTSGR